MYKAAVKLVLLYGSKIWVVMYSMMTVLEVFCHRIDRCIAEMTIKKANGREWWCTSADATLETTGLWSIR